jgi:hypothetical protein
MSSWVGGVWTRFLSTPPSFKIIALLAVTAAFLPAMSLLPGAYDMGLNKLGHPVGFIYLVLLFPTHRPWRSTKAFQFQAVAYAALMIVVTLIDYFDDARIAFPNHPSFAFYDYQWATWVALPVTIAALALTMPARNPPEERAS